MQTSDTSGAISFRSGVKKILPDFLMEALRDVKHRRQRITNYKPFTDSLCGKRGIEIGGPSFVFRHVIPVYPVAALIDGVNFSSQTIWEGKINPEGGFNYYKNRRGKQLIAEATDLSCIANNNYDFLISSNCLEHVANPIKALEEWKRIVFRGGYILLVIPNKDYNFDHNRAVTSFDHIYNDYIRDVSERDLTHLDEILDKHDISKDPACPDYDAFKARCVKNFENRCMHHHVFDLPLLHQLCEYLGIGIINSDVAWGNFIVLGQITK